MTKDMWPSEKYELVRFGLKKTILQKRPLYDGKAVGWIDQQMQANKDNRNKDTFWEIVEKGKFQIGDKIV